MKSWMADDPIPTTDEEAKQYLPLEGHELYDLCRADGAPILTAMAFVFDIGVKALESGIE